MMNAKDPNPEICLSSDALAEIALSTIRAAIGSTKYQYLSGPITGGRRFLDWHETHGRGMDGDARRVARQAAVVEPNIDEVRRAAEAERSEGRLTIEPGSFEAYHKLWQQPEFYSFWEKVIARHASRVRFLEGWEYSAGCTFEYLCAARNGLPRLDAAGSDLPPVYARGLLDGAMAVMGARLRPEDAGDKPLADLRRDVARYRDEIAALP